MINLSAGSSNFFLVANEALSYSGSNLEILNIEDVTGTHLHREFSLCTRFFQSSFEQAATARNWSFLQESTIIDKSKSTDIMHALMIRGVYLFDYPDHYVGLPIDNSIPSKTFVAKQKFDAENEFFISHVSCGSEFNFVEYTSARDFDRVHYPVHFSKYWATLLSSYLSATHSGSANDEKSALARNAYYLNQLIDYDNACRSAYPDIYMQKNQAVKLSGPINPSDNSFSS